MRWMIVCTTSVLSLALVYGCCGEKKCETCISDIEATNIHQKNATENQLAWRKAMTGAALMNDISLADIHFESHATSLNSLGRARLERYVELLGERGGMLHLESRSTNEEFSKARMESVKNFLASAGVGHDRITLEDGLSDGSGMMATEAIKVKEKAFTPPQKSKGLTDLLTGGTGGALGTQ